MSATVQLLMFIVLPMSQAWIAPLELLSHFESTSDTDVAPVTAREGGPPARCPWKLVRRTTSAAAADVVLTIRTPAPALPKNSQSVMFTAMIEVGLLPTAITAALVELRLYESSVLFVKELLVMVSVPENA